MLQFSGVPVCLSVTIEHSAHMEEDTDMISFAYNSPMSLPDSVKIWLACLYRSIPPSPNFAPK